MEKVVISIIGVDRTGIVAAISRNLSENRCNIEDVSMPVAREDDCDCTTEGADGYEDMILKFKTQEIVAALGEVEDGDELVLTLTGEINDATPIEGQDCIIVKSKGGKLKKSIVQSEVAADNG